MSRHCDPQVFLPVYCPKEELDRLIQFKKEAEFLSERFRKIDFSVKAFQAHKCLDCGDQLKTFGAKRCAPCNMRLIAIKRTVWGVGKNKVPLK